MAFFGRGLFLSLAVSAAAFSTSAAEPNWILGGYSNIPSFVRSVEKNGDAVLIKIDTGSLSKLAIGAVCFLYRADTFIAQAVVVEANRESSVAKVLSNDAVLAGDKVYIKRQPDSQ
jgi:hypothetical protein